MLQTQTKTRSFAHRSHGLLFFVGFMLFLILGIGAGLRVSVHADGSLPTANVQPSCSGFLCGYSPGAYKPNPNLGATDDVFLFNSGSYIGGSGTSSDPFTQYQGQPLTLTLGYQSFYGAGGENVYTWIQMHDTNGQIPIANITPQSGAANTKVDKCFTMILPPSSPYTDPNWSVGGLGGLSCFGVADKLCVTYTPPGGCSYQFINNVPYPVPDSVVSDQTGHAAIWFQNDNPPSSHTNGLHTYKLSITGAVTGLTQGTFCIRAHVALSPLGWPGSNASPLAGDLADVRGIDSQNGICFQFKPPPPPQCIPCFSTPGCPPPAPSCVPNNPIGPPIIGVNTPTCSSGVITGWGYQPYSGPPFRGPVAMYIYAASDPPFVYFAGPIYTDTAANSNYPPFSVPIPSRLLTGQPQTFAVYAVGATAETGPGSNDVPGATVFGSDPVNLTLDCPPLPTPFNISPGPSAKASGDDENPGTITFSDTLTLNPALPCVNGVTVTYSTYKMTVAGVRTTLPTGAGTTVEKVCNNQTDPYGQYTPPIGSFNAGDSFCIDITIYPNTGTVNSAGDIVTPGGSIFGKDCVIITNKPFFKVFSGGVSATGAFDCSSVTGELASWNNNSGVNPMPTDFGSSSQFNALALTKIVGFASNQSPSRSNGNSPFFLSFANSVGVGPGIDTTSPSLGGQFNDQHCVQDVIEPPGAATIGDNVDLSTQPGNGNYTHPGNWRIGANTISLGKHITVFAGGDVYIGGNILYQGNFGATGIGAAWSNPSSIPSFVLHAAGNIYIDPNVTELDGLYISNTSGGTIFTCGKNTSLPYPHTSLLTTCNNQLVVYGAFEADKIDLMRTYGSLRDESQTALPGTCSNQGPLGPASLPTPTCAAEVFEFSPELFLSTPNLSTPNGGAPGFDSITSLPPVL